LNGPAGIAAGSAVVGAAIGGAVSGGFSLRSDHNRRAREDQQELKLAKGAARQLRATLRQSREQMLASLEPHAWWPECETMPTSSGEWPFAPAPQASSTA
jgi:hypothetical protein